MPPTLQVLSGSRQGEKFSLDREEVRIGRLPECEVTLEFSAVSRIHCHLMREGVDFVVEDLGSRNGTFVNGKRIENAVRLKDGDRLKVCDTLFVYRLEEPKPAIAVADVSSTNVISSLDCKSSTEMMVKVKPEAKLKAILDILQVIGSTFNLTDLFDKILDGLFQIFPQADRALLILCDDQRNLIPRAVKHRRADEDTVRFSKTIVHQAMEEQKAILSADASMDSRFAMSQSIADFRIRSVMCVPLLAQDRKPLGVLQIDTQSQRHKFEQDDLQILASVAVQASISVENAQMHQAILRQEAFKRELAFAREVQKGLLPRATPSLPGYDFFAYYEAAGMVGGDYYDFIPMPRDRLAIILGDVSGKGVPAALLMSKASSDTKVSLLTHPDNPGAAMSNINNAICAAGLDDKFITMALCLLDAGSGQVRIVNAGHMSPIIRRSAGAVEEPVGDEASGLPVGVVEGADYPMATAQLNAGDLAIIYSDGISEAMDANGRQYSIERIRHVVSANSPRSAQELGLMLLQDVRAHVGSHAQSDDITLVIFGRSVV